MSIPQAIQEFPRLKARTLRFNCGAPRSARAVGDGTRALFLRSDGPEDLVTALWLSVIGPDGSHDEVLLADPRELLADAESEEVPPEERARRERAREGGHGIVSYSADAAGNRVTFTIDGRLFLTDLTQIGEDGQGAKTRQLGVGSLGSGHPEYAPVLNPRISPDGRHVLYTTGRHLVIVDIADWDDVAGEAAADGAGSTGGGKVVEADDSDDADMNPSSGAGSADYAANMSELGHAHAAYAHAHRCGGEKDSQPQTGDHVAALWGVGGDDDAEDTWRIGLAEFVAGEEMDRYDGFWWSPDSDGVIFETFDSSPEPVWYISDPTDPEVQARPRRYPRALTHNADVHLTLAGLSFDGHGHSCGLDARRIAWDRKAYEYVAAVSWSAGHRPLLLVQNRRQNRDQVLAVEQSGVTSVLEEHANEQWLDLILGTPAYTPDGRLLCAANDMEADTNRLTVDGKAFTPAGWQVRRVIDAGDENVLAIVQRTPELDTLGKLTDEVLDDSNGHAASSDTSLGVWNATRGDHDARSLDVVIFDYAGNVTPVTGEPGVYTASRAGCGMIVTGHSMNGPQATMTHSVTKAAAADHAATTPPTSAAPIFRVTIENHSATPGFTPNTTFLRLGERQLFTAITRPSAQSPYAGADKLPVLLKPYGGPGAQQVMLSESFYWDSQWWADQGFLVVTSDGRGTTGRGPRWDREIFESMKEISLADQVETVKALADAEPQADTSKVAMIGWSYGGYLSALAVLDAPDVIHAACAGAPPTDWTLYDTHYTERYLGLDPAAYESNSIIEDAPKLRRPLMLIHGFADDNVTIAHSLRLSQALVAAGRPHTYLPLTGITHMTNDETVAENLLTLQRDFLYDALGMDTCSARLSGGC
ncbi:S9 family peptidase [Bifidobacterium sp.]|jgi:dipeptidyl-peptidase-4|uniref:S9 family peptidase n=1 Tax=Bifidobacterium sp. TaxID=41200 RepID=UPI0025C71649|nr:prolyl oligopeptidase family serine peptidase [Bifidobacterium sp.]MCH4209694.1 S9 family peptidase [Bifidobacterium sp.]MCI1224536.1 S9 family peptidase [Bifidobacterium sp.]